MKVVFLLVAIYCTIPCIAQTSDVDGNQLLERCSAYLKARDNPPLTAKEQIDAGFCLGYLSGITDSNAALKRDFCAPADATIEQFARVVVKWLRDNPAKLHLNAGDVSLTALRSAFPCK